MSAQYPYLVHFECRRDGQDASDTHRVEFPFPVNQQMFDDNPNAWNMLADLIQDDLRRKGQNIPVTVIAKVQPIRGQG